MPGIFPWVYHGYTFTLFPGQPVPDLETYMQSLEKKQQALEKMIGNLSSASDDGARKSFGCIAYKKWMHNALQVNIWELHMLNHLV